MKSKLQTALKNAKKRDKTRLHMPGAKGKSLGFLNGIFKYDFTEIEGLDNLFDPKEILAISQREMAEAIGAKAAYYTVGGSSSGVLALLSLFCEKKVLMARDFHLSAAHAIDLFRIEPIFIYPKNAGPAGVISADQVKDALASDDDIAAIYLTYPNYYGFCVDLLAITALAHQKRIPVIVDAAHAACFPYSSLLPLSPANAGADAWVTSTHKTLPALNQSGYIAVNRQSLISEEDVKEALNMCVTTSPSYPIMASIDFAKDYMSKRGKKRIEKLFYAIVKYSKKIDDLAGFTVVKQVKRNEAKDVLKWVIDYQKSGLTAKTIKQALNRKGIYAEAVDPHTMLFLLSAVDTKSALKKVYKVLKKLPISSSSQQTAASYQLIPAEFKAISGKETAWIALENSQGKVAAKAVAVYPPGVPAVLKGQALNADLVLSLKTAKDEGLSVVGMKENFIKVYIDK